MGSRRSRSSRGAKDTARNIKLLLARDGRNCQWCGYPINFTIPPGVKNGPSVDHIRPRAAGGSNQIENLQLVHANTCANAKGAWWEGVNYAKLTDPNRPKLSKAEASAIATRLRRKQPPVITNSDWLDGSDWDTPVLPC